MVSKSVGAKCEGDELDAFILYDAFDTQNANWGVVLCVMSPSVICWNKILYPINLHSLKTATLWTLGG